RKWVQQHRCDESNDRPLRPFLTPIHYPHHQPDEGRGEQNRDDSERDTHAAIVRSGDSHREVELHNDCGSPRYRQVRRAASAARRGCPKRDARDQPHQVARSAPMMDSAKLRSELASAVAIFLPLWAWTKFSNASNWLAAVVVLPSPSEART